MSPSGLSRVDPGDEGDGGRRPRVQRQMRFDAFSVVGRKTPAPKATIVVGGATPQSGRDALAKSEASSVVASGDRSPPLGLFVPAEAPARASVEETLVGRVLDQRYRIDARIGIGGMGVVFRATHVIIDKALAIKVLRSEHAAHPEVVQRFLLEAQLASQIKHPNVVDISDYGQVVAGGAAYYVMEHLSGRTLAQTIDGDGRLAPRRAVRIAVQIARGLEAAHARGIIHRDLKPDNVFLCVGPDGQEMAKILDFGIARGLNKKTRLTARGVLVGTPAYMSPEQALSSDVDARSDIYSLGVILFEMLTASLPFGDKGPMEQVNQHLFRAPPTLAAVCPDLPEMPAIERVLRRILSKNRDDRPASASAVIELLHAAEADDLSGPEHSITASGRRRVNTATIGSGSVADSMTATISGEETIVDDDALTQPRGDRDDLAHDLAAAADARDAAQARTVSPSGRIQKRPSVIVKRGTKVERIEAPPPRPVRPDKKTDAALGVLSALSSERLEQPRGVARRRGPPMALVIGVAAVVAMALTVSVWKYWKRSAARTSLAASGGPSAGRRPPIDYVRLRFETSPPNAEVLRGSRDLIGRTPIDFQVPRGGEAIVYSFRLDGHVDSARTVVPDHDQTVSVTLEARAAATMTTPTATTSTSGGDTPATATTTIHGAPPTGEAAIASAGAPTSTGTKSTKPRRPPQSPTTTDPGSSAEPPASPEKPPQTPPEAELGELKNPFATPGGGK